MKNGKWIADVVVGKKPDGTPDRRSSTCKSKSEAKKVEEQLFLTRAMKRGETKADVLFGDFVENVYWPQKGNLAKTTVVNYKRDINLRLMPAFAHMRLKDINHMAIQAMLNECPTRKTATNARDTLSAILRVAVESELIDSNPARHSAYTFPRTPRAQKAQSEDWITSFGEIMKVLDYEAKREPGGPIERVLVLGLCCGLRKEEIIGMDWEMVDFDKKRVHVVQTCLTASHSAYLDVPKTDNSLRYVPLPDYAVGRMQTWSMTPEVQRNVYGDNTHPVITYPKDSRINPHTCGNLFRRWKKGRYPDGSPLPQVTPRMLRHSFATSNIRAGTPVPTVSAWLGHERISTTYDRYVKPLLADTLDDVSLLNLEFQKAAENIAAADSARA